MLDLRDFGGVYLISYWNAGDYRRHEEQNCPACFYSTPQQGVCKHESNTECLISTLLTSLSYWRSSEMGLIRYIVVIFAFCE